MLLQPCYTAAVRCVAAVLHSSSTLCCSRATQQQYVVLQPCYTAAVRCVSAAEGTLCFLNSDDISIDRRAQAISILTPGLQGFMEHTPQEAGNNLIQPLDEVKYMHITNFSHVDGDDSPGTETDSLRFSRCFKLNFEFSSHSVKYLY